MITETMYANFIEQLKILNNNISKQNEIYPKSKQVGANISNNHLKYALTWFSLAVSIFLIYLYFRKKNY